MAGMVTALASCGGKMKLDTKLDTRLDVKKEVNVEPKKEAPPPPPPEPTTDELLTKAVDSEARPIADKARDQYRHPVETLQFFGLNKDMTVLEVEPGEGWYTRILAPVLKDKGQLIVTSTANLDPESDEAKAQAAYEKMLVENKATFGDVKIQAVGDDGVFGAPESVDLVVSFRNNHFWAKAKKQETKIYKGIFDVLKPGGYFGVVMHRADAKTKAKKALRKGYLPEKYVIDRAVAAGFELVEKSEINANPKDTKDYGRGVWSLPPVLAFGDQDKDKYLAIGESDRMTLLFKKPGGEPAAKPETDSETTGTPGAATDKPETVEKTAEKVDGKAEKKADKNTETPAKKVEEEAESALEKLQKKVATAADKVETDIETSNAQKKVEKAADKVDKEVQEITSKNSAEKKSDATDDPKAVKKSK